MRPIRAIATVPFAVACITLFSGCGLAGRFSDQATGDVDVPISHAHAIQRAFRAALESAGIPGGDNNTIDTIELSISNGQIHSGLLLPIAQMYLQSRGFDVGDNPGGTMVQITVDSLGVTLGREGGATVNRVATVNAAIAFVGTGHIRTVFESDGTYRDTFTLDMLSSLDNNEAYVTNNLHLHRIKDRIQPLLVAVTMTVLAWMLYSYRG